tara:strand:- start:308 stop:655 length:348 start_codon:yes stop_codon:yes gene_type:complete
MKVDKTELLKTAAAKLRGLVEEKEKLNSEIEHRKHAQQVLGKFVEKDLLDSPKAVLTKFAELLESNQQDLEVTEKAISLETVQRQEPELSKLGSLSDHDTGDGLDPLTRLLIEDL